MKVEDWDSLLHRNYQYNDYEYPFVSVIIPAYNQSERLPLTLDSILAQHYPYFEILLIDGGSQDRTVQVAQNYRDERIKIFSVEGYHRYQMLNKGLAEAKGEYINCLFAGDFYIHSETLLQMMERALDQQKPDLVYCGTLIRDGRNDPKILFRHLSLDLLKKGLQSTSLQSCWFRRDCLEELKGFNTNYVLRGGFELLCRFCLDGKRTVAKVDRVLTDYDLRLVNRSMVWDHFIETFKTIWKYFGALQALKWLLIQKDLYRLIHIWIRGLKVAFLGHS